MYYLFIYTVLYSETVLVYTHLTPKGLKVHFKRLYRTLTL